MPGPLMPRQQREPEFGAAPEPEGESELVFDPPPSQWMAMIDPPRRGMVFGRELVWWRKAMREELGLDAQRPLIATGHQTLLWHPGILAKFIAAGAFAAAHELATANLVVEQHAAGFGAFDVPVRGDDGSPGLRRLELCRARLDVPMGRHEAFAPPPAPEPLNGALPSVSDGVQRIYIAVRAHRDAANAAEQMAHALDDLMRPWVSAHLMPRVMAGQLLRTTLGGAMLREMVNDPHRCAAAYNEAVAAVPEAGIPPLLVRDDAVELPLWRIVDDGRRLRAFDSDAAAAVEQVSLAETNPKSKIQNPKSPAPDLFPRALLMTALVRLGMCDLFIHGTGGATYDRAMELWIRNWLGVDVSPRAIVSATLRLPLLGDEASVTTSIAARSRLRRLLHDPASEDAGLKPSAMKQALLQQVDAAPRGSPERRRCFFEMHEQLESLRATNRGALEKARTQLRQAERLAADLAIAERRDWAFPLYPEHLIDALASAIEQRVRA